MGDGYVFFEIISPEALSYTYKITPAAFTPSWYGFSSVNFMNIVLKEICEKSYKQFTLVNHDSTVVVTIK